MPGARLRLPLAAAIIGLALAFSSRAAESPSSMPANELASRLSALRQDGESYVRLRMDIKASTKETLQLQIKERRTQNSTEVVYQVLFPKERKGESVLLRKSGNGFSERFRICAPEYRSPDRRPEGAAAGQRSVVRGRC
jgi:hypothetical protein